MPLNIPFSILAIAVAIYIGAQIGAINQSNQTSQWQLSNLDVQMTNLHEAEAKMKTLSQERTELVKQAEQVQAQYVALLNDVLALSKDDEDAKKVVDKWNIKVNKPAETKTGDTPKTEVSGS